MGLKGYCFDFFRPGQIDENEFWFSGKWDLVECLQCVFTHCAQAFYTESHHGIKREMKQKALVSSQCQLVVFIDLVKYVGNQENPPYNLHQALKTDQALSIARGQKQRNILRRYRKGCSQKREI
jgi:hypothetical protein